MKKFILAFLILSMCVAIVGCSHQENYDAIDKELQGVWKGNRALASTVYTFDEGTFEYYAVNAFGGEITYTGEYKIEDGKITFSSIASNLTYTYDKQSGTLKIYDDGQELTLFYSYGE